MNHTYEIEVNDGTEVVYTTQGVWGESFLPCVAALVAEFPQDIITIVIAPEATQ